MRNICAWLGIVCRESTLPRRKWRPRVYRTPWWLRCTSTVTAYRSVALTLAQVQKKKSTLITPYPSLTCNLYYDDILARFQFRSVQFSSVQDGIYALRKAHMRPPTPSLRSFPSVALETVPMSVWLTMALSHPLKKDLSTPLSSPRSGVLRMLKLRTPLVGTKGYQKFHLACGEYNVHKLHQRDILKTIF